MLRRFMKNFKVIILSLVFMALCFASNQRVAILAIAAANYLSIVNQAHAYNVPITDETASPTEQAQAAVQNVNNPSFGLSDSVIGGALSGLTGDRGHSKGLQF